MAKKPVAKKSAATPALPVAAEDLSPPAMLNRAIMSGATVDTVAKLMDLQERWELNNSRRAFEAAMAAAKAEIPVIFKNREVDFTSARGRTNYRHEDLGEIMRTVDPVLARHGLNVRFNTSNDDRSVTVTCRVAHADGYSESNSLTGPLDLSGNKNPHQSLGSAITYLQRYTMKAALGLAASTDDDAQGAGVEDITPISEDDLKLLRASLAEVGGSEAKFASRLGVAKLEDLLASQRDLAMQVLRDGQRAAERKAAALREEGQQGEAQQ